MNTLFPRPITYLITSGTVDPDNFKEKRKELIGLVQAAVESKISLVQIREKLLDTISLFRLVEEAAEITRLTSTKLLVNDRVDVAIAAGAHGVHLTTRSLPLIDIRAVFGHDMIVAVSTHTMAEAKAAADAGADIIVFGPVFVSPGKGPAVGLMALEEVSRAVASPVVGLGGINPGNLSSVLATGAAGVAGIRCFNDRAGLDAIVSAQGSLI